MAGVETDVALRLEFRTEKVCRMIECKGASGQGSKLQRFEAQTSWFPRAAERVGWPQKSPSMPLKCRSVFQATVKARAEWMVAQTRSGESSGKRLQFVHRGRYGFVDEFLRENERYRIFVPVAWREIHH